MTPFVEKKWGLQATDLMRKIKRLFDPQVHMKHRQPMHAAEDISTNRTCEIGLTSATRRPYRSIADLLEECTREEATMHC